MYSCKYTTGDKQNEIDFYGHCIEFEYNHDFEIFFLKNWNINTFI